MKLEDKQTKIVATIGPASDSQTMLKKMMRAGMNVARLNFSHGTHASHSQVFKNVRAAAAATGKLITIVADLQGPKVRLGVLDEPVTVKKGQKITLSTAINKAEGTRLPLTYKGMHKDLKPGDAVLFSDGLLEARVTKIRGREIECKVVLGGTLSSHKGAVVPTATLHVPILSAKDKADLEFAIKNNADYIAMSFVRNAKDVHNMRKLIAAAEKKYHKRSSDRTTSTKIIVKIEKHEAIDNFDEILEATDAVMVARGDLGVEIELEMVPVTQKMMIQKCLAAAKPVITATQMLVSMVEQPRPTRAEVSDVANAVIDHTDAVMLSDETAVGKHPDKVVTTMAKIIRNTERSPYDDLHHGGIHYAMLADANISQAASTLAELTEAKGIVVATISGHTARLVASYRPELPILATAQNDKLARQLNLSWGVTPFPLKLQKTIQSIVKKSLVSIRKTGAFKHGDDVVVVAGDPPGIGVVNYVKVEKV